VRWISDLGLRIGIVRRRKIFTAEKEEKEEKGEKIFLTRVRRWPNINSIESVFVPLLCVLFFLCGENLFSPQCACG